MHAAQWTMVQFNPILVGTGGQWFDASGKCTINNDAGVKAMKLRASIARALVTEPQLLLMDEPFAALDEITRFKLNNELLVLWQALRRTVIFVTHSVFESVYLSQRIIVMTPRPGRVAADIAIPAPYPRDERFRTSAEYAGYCRTVSEALSQAMRGPS